MKCKEAYRRICDNLDADPNSARCRQVLKHLETCQDCAALMDAVKKTVSLYKSAPSPRVPSATHRRLIKTIDLAWELRSTPRRRAPR